MQLHYAALAVVLTVLALVGVRYLLRPRPTTGSRRSEAQRLRRPPRAILVLGAAAFCTMLAEGAAVDWSAVYLSRSFGAAAGVAALAYTAFAFMMMTSRAVGDRLNRRLGAVTLARSGAALATIGLGLALVIGSVPVAIAGFAAMGAGLGVVSRCSSALPPRRPPSRRASASPPSRRSAGSASSPARPRSGLRRRPSGCGRALGIVVLATLTLVALAGNAEPGRRKDRVPAAGYRTSP